MLTPRTRCRTCGYIGYKPGPCHVCAVYGRYEPTDRIECVPAGQTAELRRWRKEALALRELFRSSRHEEDALRARVLRMARERERLRRVAAIVERAREGMR